LRVVTVNGQDIAVIAGIDRCGVGDRAIDDRVADQLAGVDRHASGAAAQQRESGRIFTVIAGDDRQRLVGACILLAGLRLISGNRPFGGGPRLGRRRYW